MIDAAIKMSNELKPFIGTSVGFIKVNKSWIHHNNSYECAAWWEDSQIKTGIYPLILTKNSYAPHNLYLLAKLEAEVVDDYFPALWGGVPVSDKPYDCKNLGMIRTIHHKVDLVQGIEKTGNSPGNDLDICVNPMIIGEIINAARQSMEDYRGLLDKYWSDYQKNGDGNYGTNLNMISHCTENMASLGRAIERMKMRMDCLEKPTDYMREVYMKNMKWAA